MLLTLPAGCGRELDKVWCIRLGPMSMNCAEFRDRLERFASDSLVTDSRLLEQLKPAVVENCLNELLIERYAREHGITVSEEEVDIAVRGITADMGKGDMETVLTEEVCSLSDLRATVRRNALIKKTEDRALRDKISISDKALNAYYASHRAEFTRPETVELYHVALADSQRASRALEALRAGEPLAKVLDTFAGAHQASASGFMGVFARGELPLEVERVVFSLPERRYSGIIESQRGYHIFYVQRRNPAGLMAFEQARDSVRELLTDKALEDAYAKWLRELKAQYRPEVNWDAIKDIKIN